MLWVIFSSLELNSFASHPSKETGHLDLPGRTDANMSTCPPYYGTEAVKQLASFWISFPKRYSQGIIVNGSVFWSIPLKDKLAVIQVPGAPPLFDPTQVPLLARGQQWKQCLFLIHSICTLAFSLRLKLKTASTIKNLRLTASAPHRLSSCFTSFWLVSNSTFVPSPFSDQLYKHVWKTYQRKIL